MQSDESARVAFWTEYMERSYALGEPFGHDWMPAVACAHQERRQDEGVVEVAVPVEERPDLFINVRHPSDHAILKQFAQAVLGRGIAAMVDRALPQVGQPPLDFRTGQEVAPELRAIDVASIRQQFGRYSGADDRPAARQQPLGNAIV
jgi:hypothetical protein